MTTYAPAFGDSIYTGATAATEDLSRVGGFVAGCGQAALLVALNAVKGVPTTPSDVTALIKQAVNAGQVTGGLASSGESSPSNLEALANSQGVQLESGDYHTLLSQYAGTKPIILGVSNARVFGGSDINVAGHYITVVGRTINGDYIVSDPNTAASQAAQFVTYTPGQIAASQPFWAATPTAPVLGGLGGGLLNLVLPSWINDLGARITAFTASGWANPLRIVKFFLGISIIAFVVGAIVLEGGYKTARFGEHTAGRIIKPAADAITTAGNVIASGD